MAKPRTSADPNRAGAVTGSAAVRSEPHRDNIGWPAVEYTTNANLIRGNIFIDQLRDLFGFDSANWAIELYLVGTWADKSAVFWYFQDETNIAGARLVRYPMDAGKTGGEQRASWLNRRIGSPSWRGLERSRSDECYFGEHLLSVNPGLPVAVVQRESTAVVASIAYPDTIWLATGPLQALMTDRLLRIANGRRVTLYPNTNTFDEWRALVDSNLGWAGRVRISELLQTRMPPATEIAARDIGDVIVDLHCKGSSPAEGKAGQRRADRL